MIVINENQRRLIWWFCLFCFILLLYLIFARVKCYTSGGIYLFGYERCTHIKYSFNNLKIFNKVPANISDKPNLMLNTSKILKSRLWLKNVLN